MLSDEQISIFARAIKDDVKKYIEKHPQEFMLFLQKRCNAEQPIDEDKTED